MRRRTDRQKNTWMKERTTQDEREMSARQRVIWSPPQILRNFAARQWGECKVLCGFCVCACARVCELASRGCVCARYALACFAVALADVLRQKIAGVRGNLQWGRRGRAVPIGVCARWPVGRKGKNAYSLRVAHGL